MESIFDSIFSFIDNFMPTTNIGLKVLALSIIITIPVGVLVLILKQISKGFIKKEKNEKIYGLATLLIGNLGFLVYHKANFTLDLDKKNLPILFFINGGSVLNLVEI